MFQAKTVMFLYSISPVHMGAGTALGAVDNPIQRERHTQHPMLAGSGLKGALRDAWANTAGDEDVVFGPDPTRASDHAGALSVSDAQVVLFPVRSLRQSYVYATSRTALARLERMLTLAGTTLGPLPDAPPDDDSARIPPGRAAHLCGAAPRPSSSSPNAKASGNATNRPPPVPPLVLETFAFHPLGDEKLGKLSQTLSEWLSDHLGDHFRSKVAADIVLLSDTRFDYFVRHATVVEPHVRIDDATGTADDGGLFYTENVPPETLFASLVMASDSRKPHAVKKAADVLASVRDAYDNKLLQIGGDATTGRGQVLVSFVGS